MLAALCDSGKPGLGTTVFVTVRTSQHNDAWLRKVELSDVSSSFKSTTALPLG